MRIVAFITEAWVIRRNLDCLGLVSPCHPRSLSALAAGTVPDSL
jgi:hypothetical protein